MRRQAKDSIKSVVRHAFNAYHSAAKSDRPEQLKHSLYLFDAFARRSSRPMHQAVAKRVFIYKLNDL